LNETIIKQEQTISDNMNNSNEKFEKHKKQLTDKLNDLKSLENENLIQSIFLYIYIYSLKCSKCVIYNKY
jgi:hypothetical protein